MATKEFLAEQTLPAKELRVLSQKDLLEKLNQYDKMGVIVKDELKIAMMSMETFEAMVDRINELENLVEDMEFAERFGERLRLSESDWEEKPKRKPLKQWYQERKANGQ